LGIDIPGRIVLEKRSNLDQQAPHMATLVGFTNYRRASIGRGDIVLGKTTSIDESLRVPADNIPKPHLLKADTQNVESFPSHHLINLFCCTHIVCRLS
jgi:hypothetical protein